MGISNRILLGNSTLAIPLAKFCRIFSIKFTYFQCFQNRTHVTPRKKSKQILYRALIRIGSRKINPKLRLYNSRKINSSFHLDLFSENCPFDLIPIRKNNPTFSYVLHVIFAILFLIDIQKYQFRNAFANLTHNPQENVGLFLRIGIIPFIRNNGTKAQEIFEAKVHLEIDANFYKLAR